MDFEDRRNFERFSLDLPLSYSRVDRQERNYMHAHDISAEGLGVTSDSLLALGTEMDISLSLPSIKQEIPVKAKVVWAKKYGEKSFRCGLSLEQAGVMDISTILRFVHSRNGG